MQTLQTLDKLRENDNGQNTKRSERATIVPIVLTNHQQFISPDEGSGSPPFSDDDDYNGASGMSPFDESSGDNVEGSQSRNGDDGIIVDDVSTTIVATSEQSKAYVMFQKYF